MGDYYSIDRLEGDLAVCEAPDGQMENVPLELLPPDAEEGALLRRTPEGGWEVDWQATRERREAMRRRLAALLKRK